LRLELQRPSDRRVIERRITVVNRDSVMTLALSPRGRYACVGGMPVVDGLGRLDSDAFGAQALLECVADGSPEGGPADFVFVDTNSTHTVAAAGRTLGGGRMRFDSLAAIWG